jgi:hypothetical protein
MEFETTRRLPGTLVVCLTLGSAWACGGQPAATTLTAPDADTVADAGDPQFFTESPDGGVLQARIQVNGAHTTCGTCAVLIAEVLGGTAPYQYTWSDPSLTGPGPHEVCPDAPTHYTLTVTDSSGRASGELSMPAQKVQVSSAVDCVPPAADASSVAGALAGCHATGTDQTEAMDAGLECTANETATGASAFLDGGVSASHASKLPGTLIAGQPYSFSYDRLLPLDVGQPVTVDVYGSNEPDICAADEKLFTMVLDGSLASWNQTFCFTPKKSYEYSISNVSIGGVLFYTSSFAGTLCTGCSM